MKMERVRGNIANREKISIAAKIKHFPYAIRVLNVKIFHFMSKLNQFRF